MKKNLKRAYKMAEMMIDRWAQEDALRMEEEDRQRSPEYWERCAPNSHAAARAGIEREAYRDVLFVPARKAAIAELRPEGVNPREWEEHMWDYISLE